MIEYINTNTTMISPNSTIDFADMIFSVPIYVDSEGVVSNLTQAERIEMHHRYYNFTCKYYDPTQGTFSSSGLIYNNLTNHYVQCNTTHLSEFVPYIYS